LCGVWSGGSALTRSVAAVSMCWRDTNTAHGPPMPVTSAGQLSVAWLSHTSLGLPNGGVPRRFVAKAPTSTSPGTSAPSALDFLLLLAVPSTLLALGRAPLSGGNGSVIIWEGTQGRYDCEARYYRKKQCTGRNIEECGGEGTRTLLSRGGQGNLRVELLAFRRSRQGGLCKQHHSGRTGRLLIRTTDPPERRVHSKMYGRGK
jgi:hypothetical protein